MSIEDLKKLAQMRNVTASYDAGKRKLTVGKKEFELIPVDPKSKDFFFWGKVRHIIYNGTPYFDRGIFT